MKTTSRIICWALVAMLLAIPYSCEKGVLFEFEEIDNPNPSTEDALGVMSNHSYVMYGAFDEELGQALGRRLQGTMTSPNNADVFIIDPSAIRNSNLMSINDLKTLIRRTESGDAAVILTKATFREFYDWAQLYVLGYLAFELENYYGDMDYDAQAAAPARQKMANIVRNAYVAGQPQTAKTRSVIVNGLEMDWEHVDSWPAEKQNAIMFDGFAQSGSNELFIMNAAATLNADAEVRHPQNDHEWGHKADALTRWLKRRDTEKAQTRAGLLLFTQAATKAGASTDISDLMSAQTKDFVFDYQFPGLGGPEVCTRYSAITVQYRAYSAYDFNGKVEYYQVRQSITAMNDQIHGVVTGINDWFVRSNDGEYSLARGGWMKRIDTKMWIEGPGSRTIVSAAPLNANGESSGSTSSGGSYSTTVGSSDGVSVGISVGMSGWSPTFSASDTYTHTASYSDTESTTWNTSTNWCTQDLSTVCSQGNDEKATVTWTHTGNTPTDFDGTFTANIKPLLKSTCVTDEQVLWKVEGPSDKYTLNASFNVVSEICKIKGGDWDKDAALVTQDNPHEISFELNAPDRFKRKWNCVINNYGSVTGDVQLSHMLDEFVESSYGNGSASFCWATLFTSTEFTADASDNAASVFQTFKNSIRGMKQQLRVKGFGGRLEFGLKPDGIDVDGNPYDLVDQVALALDGTGYNEGETFTEQFNGYDITYLVTKKGSEVELNNVPTDFSGELIIPEKVSEGILTVTSLGDNCAVGRKGITAVTIPGTVRTIENGALAELNITEINIPEGVEAIGTWAFHLDSKTTKVSLPSTLKTIDYCAFYEMDVLAEVHIKATTPPELGILIFEPRYNDAVLYVPKGCKDAYANATEWSYFKNIVEE